MDQPPRSPKGNNDGPPPDDTTFPRSSRNVAPSPSRPHVRQPVNAAPPRPIGDGTPSPPPLLWNWKRKELPHPYVLDRKSSAQSQTIWPNHSGEGNTRSDLGAWSPSSNLSVTSSTNRLSASPPQPPRLNPTNGLIPEPFMDVQLQPHATTNAASSFVNSGANPPAASGSRTRTITLMGVTIQQDVADSDSPVTPSSNPHSGVTQHTPPEHINQPPSISRSIDVANGSRAAYLGSLISTLHQQQAVADTGSFIPQFGTSSANAHFGVPQQNTVSVGPLMMPRSSSMVNEQTRTARELDSRSSSTSAIPPSDVPRGSNSCLCQHSKCNTEDCICHQSKNYCTEYCTCFGRCRNRSCFGNLHGKLPMNGCGCKVLQCKTTRCRCFHNRAGCLPICSCQDCQNPNGSRRGSPPPEQNNAKRPRLEESSPPEMEITSAD